MRVCFKLVLAALLLTSSASRAQVPLPTTAERTEFVSGDVITLGTGGGPLLRLTRAQSSSLLYMPAGVAMIDVGEGALRQLTATAVPPSDIVSLYITHLHTDHVADLGSLLLHRWVAKAGRPLQIYGPKGTRGMVEGLLASAAPIFEASAALGAPPAAGALVVVAEVDPKAEARIAVSTTGGMRVSAVVNSHLDGEKAARPDLKIASLSYRFDLPNRAVVFTGDTGPSAAVESLAAGADVLVGEVVDVDAAMRVVARDFAYDRTRAEQLRYRMGTGHLTATQLGELAARAKVAKLVISHIVPGIDDQQGSAMLADVRRAFSGSVVIARDLQRY